MSVNNMNNTPYLYPYQLPNGQVTWLPYPPQQPAAPQTAYRQANGRTH